MREYRRVTEPKAMKDPLKTLLATNRFLISARDTQVPPPDLMRTWLLSGGRGAGKTRAGAEWVRWALMIETQGPRVRVLG